MGRYEVPQVMDSPPSKPLRTTPYKQQVHWLFYVPAYAYAYAYANADAYAYVYVLYMYM